MPCGSFSVRSPTTFEATGRSDKPNSKIHNTTTTRISSYKTHSNPKSFTKAKLPGKLRPAPYFKRPLGEPSKRNSSVANNSMGGLEQISEEQKSFEQFHKNKLKLQSINDKIKYLKSGEANFARKTHKKNPSRVYGYQRESSLPPVPKESSSVPGGRIYYPSWKQTSHKRKNTTNIGRGSDLSGTH
mmetsp:Transcript_34108/g.33670  ORF Transcript_34108/g.33670 Transcript_34108/m.33670 type:complete len:186 (+) Transcript_34108:1285-1842(+)